MTPLPSTLENLSSPGLWRWVRKMVLRGVSDQDADDVVQQIALRATRRAYQYDPAKGKITTWLRWMIVEAVRQHHRQRGRRPCEGLPCGLAQRRERQPDAAAMTDEASALVRAAVSRLPRRSREAVELSLAGQSPSQVGRTLGRSKQAAAFRIRRAHGLLLVEMGGREREAAL